MELYLNIMARISRETAVYGLALALAVGMVYRVQGYLRVYDVGEGDRAPGFSVTDEQGVGVSLDDYRGKVVLLNFWATWCPPCVQEMPSLDALYQELRGRGFVVVGISVDEDDSRYRAFLDSSGVTFPTARDPERAVSVRYGTMKYPESYLISREGRVLRKYVGPEDWLRPEIANYLRSVL